MVYAACTSSPAVDESAIARLRERATSSSGSTCRGRPRTSVERARRACSACTPSRSRTRCEFGQRPKVDPYDDHVLFVFYTARVTDDATARASRSRSTSTSPAASSPPSATTTARARRAARRARRPSRRTTRSCSSTAILDGLTDAFYPVIEALEQRDRRARGRGPAPARAASSSPQIYRLKQDVRELHRLVAAQRDQFHSRARRDPRPAGLSQRLARRTCATSATTWPRSRASSSARPTTSSRSPQTYFNANSDRLNAVATRLTIGGTLFVVWTLVTGFFGQNFGWLVRPHRHAATHFLLFGVGGLVVPTVILLTLFWVKRARLVLSRGDTGSAMSVDTSQIAQLDVEPGELPPTMAAWVIRDEREGEPTEAFQLEEMEVPRAGRVRGDRARDGRGRELQQRVGGARQAGLGLPLPRRGPPHRRLRRLRRSSGRSARA